ncbi:MAG: sel1 repeat family protein, partial [Deltaproteobacteria bacterium]|nr:sel1 repeat family protein [Deltaproteobacteria bacterium]
LNGKCRHCDVNFQTRIFYHPDFKKPDPRKVSGADPSEIEGIEDTELIARWYLKFAKWGDPYAQSVYGMFCTYGYGVPRDFAQSAQWFRIAADGGDAYAQASLGIMLVKGQGLPNNLSEAFKYFQFGAKQGNPEAQNNLAIFLHHGFCGPKDPIESFRLFYKAAEQNGLSVAYLNLGFNELEPQTENGFKNPKQAFVFFQKAANAGTPAGYHYMGFLCAQGAGVPKDPKLAAEYFQKAADGWLMSTFYLGVAYLIGFGVPKDIPKGVALIEKATQLEPRALPRFQTFLGLLSKLGLSKVPLPYDFGEFLHQSSERDLRFVLANQRDDDLIQYCYGFLLSKGIIVPQDLQKSKHYLQKSSDLGNSYAKNYLGLMYLGEKGSSRFLSPSSEKFLGAAKKGHAEAQFNLSLLFLDGVDIPQDLIKGMQWLEAAVNLNHRDAQYLLGKFLLEGIFILKDTAVAVMILEKAAEQGQINAQSLLGIMFLEGKDIPQDINRATEWLLKAAEQGDTLAKEKLKKIWN